MKGMRSVAIPFLVISLLSGDSRAEPQGGLPWSGLKDPFPPCVVELIPAGTTISEALEQLKRSCGKLGDVDWKLRIISQRTLSESLRPEKQPFDKLFYSLIGRLGLTYGYDPDPQVNEVVVAENGGLGTTEGRIFPQGFVDATDIRHLASSLGMEDLTFRQLDSNLLLVTGTQENLERLAKLVKEMERYRAQKFQGGNMEDLDEVITETITLTYANVGTTTTTFQGEKITTPGILESLNAFGLDLEVRSSLVNKKATVGDDKTNLKPVTDSELSTEGLVRPILAVDQRTNSVIIRGVRSEVNRIIEVIRKLDREQPLVEIQVQIVVGGENLSLELGGQLGVTGLGGENVKLAEGNTPSDLGNSSLATTTNLVTNDISTRIKRTAVASVLSQAPGLSSASFLYRGGRALLDATLNLLKQNNMAETIASPHVVTLNNLPARITSARNFSFVIADAQKAQQTGIESVRTGISLEITPSVLGQQGHYAESSPDDEKLVRMVINARNSTPDTVAGSGSDVSTTEQEVQTTVILPQNKTFVLGGLFTTVRSEVQEGIPLLMDIPILGWLFKHETSKNEKAETVFLITPRVWNLEDMREKADKDLRSQRYRELGHTRKENFGLSLERRLHIEETGVPQTGEEE